MKTIAKSTRRSFLRAILAGFFVLAGLNHFLNPEPYLAMMPPYLPAHHTLVWISGVAEILGGIGVLFRFTRELTGWCLIVLLVAIFPANLHVALNGWPGVDLPPWVLWARLPLQILMIVWVHRLCIHGQTSHAMFVDGVREVEDEKRRGS